MDDSLDYEELGLMAGLEIHQQLDTETKLFCDCPTVVREEEDATHDFERYLHPTKSELGEIDQAALEESRVDRKFTYKSYDTTCLVEEDDEPPRPMNRDAVGVALEIAEAFGMERVDHAHVMRKIVIDGSNTTGFQRTSFVAHDGVVETSEGDVRVDALALEEESARRLGETDEGPIFSLDRLGIPLVELGTAPDIRSPEQARETAQRIGMVLRSTGKVKRGLGTIRQDLNVSIEDGARIEMKGVQDLSAIDEMVENEVRRQKELVEIAYELEERGASVGVSEDVTDVFEDTDSGVIQGALSGDGAVVAVLLEGFDSLVGREIQPDRRLGTEFADRAKKRGAGGVFHTDELPAYGVTEDEVDALRDAVGASTEDAVAIVADDEETAWNAVEAVAERAEQALEGVPEETRDANDDGTSSYLRPLPGAARMYPETDVYSVALDGFEAEPPELLDERAERYAAEHGLDDDLAERVAHGRRMPLYEEAVERGYDAGLVASTLEGTLVDLRRDDVPVENISDEDLLETFRLVAEDEVAKEGVPDLLRGIAEGGEPEEVAEELGLESAARDEVEEVVDEILEERAEYVKEEGMSAMGGLMGVVMEEMRGKADGELVSEVLREKIQERVGS
ncbi:MAG: Glu-tRNA(Gln) amidotransferase subunit GatE [Halobacteriales archaeon]|nr:Glu-tRNA(Gln) amidotransferase subunit GatE [Halobacteriales archaeon]